MNQTPDPTLPSEIEKQESPPIPALAGPRPESPPWGTITKAIVASAGLILLALAIWRFRTLLSPLVLAAIVAYLLDPSIRWLRRKTNIQRAYAVLIVYLLVLLIFSGFSIFLGGVLAQQTVRLWDSLPDLLPAMVDEVQERTARLGALNWGIGPYTVDFGDLYDSIDWESVGIELRNTVQNLLGRGGLWLVNVAQATVSTVTMGLFVLVVSVYLSTDAPRFGQNIKHLAQQPGYGRDVERLMDSTTIIWNAYLRGQIILGLVIFTVVWTSLTIAGVNSALELGILSGLLEFLPIIGPVIGTAAAVIVALFQGTNQWGMSPWLFALLVLGIMFAIQQLENAILVPRIVGDSLDLPPLVVIIGVFMGTSLAGLLGAVLAAPVLASLKLYGMYAWRKMLDLPPFMEPAPDAAAREEVKSNPGLRAYLSTWLGNRTPGD